MITDKDLENVVKATQAADLLFQDLLALSRTDDPLLAEFALGFCVTAGNLKQRLERLETITKPG